MHVNLPNQLRGRRELDVVTHRLRGEGARAGVGITRGGVAAKVGFDLEDGCECIEGFGGGERANAIGVRTDRAAISDRYDERHRIRQMTLEHPHTTTA